MEKRLLVMCRTDPSEFVRRTVVHFISQWRCTGTMLIACLVTMCDAVALDVDCDVRCAAVRFWRQYLPGVELSVASSCCQTAVLAGGVSCLLSAVSDCDRTVRLETLKTLVDVRRLAETRPSLLLPAKHRERGRLFHGVSCDHICLNRDFLNAGLRRLPPSFECAVSADERDCNGSTTPVNCDGAEGGQLSSVVDDDDDNDDDVAYYSVSLLTRLQATLLGTDWESLLASESRMSDDCHAGNPCSLLDDILKTARRERDVSSGIDDDDESQGSVVIDCY